MGPMRNPAALPIWDPYRHVCWTTIALAQSLASIELLASLAFQLLYSTRSQAITGDNDDHYMYLHVHSRYTPGLPFHLKTPNCFFPVGFWVHRPGLRYRLLPIRFGFEQVSDFDVCAF